MHTLLLTLHSLVRWVVVIAAVAAVGQAIRGWLTKREWAALDDRLGLVFTVSMDVQLLTGIILYLVSPLIQAAMQDFGAAMSAPALRFFAVEHVALMIVAVVLAHVGRALVKRTADSAGQHKRAAILFGLAFLVLLVAIPWPFLYPDRPWFRLG